IDITPDGIMLVDLDSTGGTWLDGAEVTSTRIGPGTRFRLGGRIVLECVPVEPAQGAIPAPAAPPEEDDSTRFIAPEVVAASLKPQAPAEAPSSAKAQAPAPAAPAAPVAPPTAPPAAAAPAPEAPVRPAPSKGTT